jgi:hypothetical protein
LGDVAHRRYYQQQAELVRMYIALSWSVLAPADPIDVESEIFSAINALAFDNIFNPQDNLFLADIRRNFTRQQVQLLHDALKPVSNESFTYAITVSPSFWDIAASGLDADALRRIVKYET